VLADYAAFFRTSGLLFFSVTVAVWERAARIRAMHGFRALDSVHLATAVEYGCGSFLTNDGQLARFPDIAVQILT
jgi:predicted nucleic acid-binding protein